jgi:L-fuconolactonase
MKIDGHQHFWKVNRGDYHWMSPTVPVLHRDYLPDDLTPHLTKHRIARTILVQAAQTVAESNYLLELAAKHSFIAGVIGWLDLESPDFPRQFELYRNNPRFIGLRPMLQDISDPAWIVRPQVLKALKLVAENDFPFEFLTYTRHLPYVLQALESVGPLRAVIDHISKPEIRERKLEPWKQFMSQAGRHEALYCKLSGMITEADPVHWSTEDLRPYIEHAVDSFGWDRVIFGSDWPVCLLAGSYDQVIQALIEVLRPRMDEEAERKLFGINAARFYKLVLETYD